MNSAAHPVVGIDIGGSGIKGAPVDLATGELIAERVRIPTPRRATPKACADIVAEIVAEFTPLVGQAPVGIAIPGPVVHGVIPMMANLDKSWVGVNADALFTERLGRPVVMVNDADAAGLAEVRYGSAKGHPGVVIVTTLGTGIGTAIINNGVLLPNTELGHIEVAGHDAETRASAGVKTRQRLSYRRWAKRLQLYYSTMEKLFWPDLFVVGGGVSKSSEKFLPLLQLNTPIVPATLLNQAGIVGAAVVAAERAEPGHTPPQRAVPAPHVQLDRWDDPRA
ncbi:ROK family protein [Brooklawnia cerclae]|uniref:Polyphosphate glucokinase n=1 Tax=Brooklawnia cerclae TaxID=349934 RepID=A0ABX0SND1_9ACTN|nr:ROK family protein [Brooklawnia cerclae]NIH58286.1 polyphosphate glucokinase [Brooklawnia cerclae]